MEQYAIYKNIGVKKAAYPYLLNVLHPAASGFGNSVMVPLVPLARMTNSPPKKLCPLLKVQHKHYVLMTHIPGGIPPREIGDHVMQLDGEIYEVKNAFDFLLNGI
ncbi:cytotoxin [Rahnella sp. Lac-M11]|jgi:toxin CcdB|uniref:Toxin CcdB n=1 Tax=Rahnella contaminans TaxID=2703882 RepID=A0A6M2B3C5_9GAMM|nr:MULTISPECIES: CcdB family protein [Rahnella]MDF1892453.1 CcdB family protein [Rahnella contaminans]NGX87389.1 cytotoxin [Rahnella contaminans]